MSRSRVPVKVYLVDPSNLVRGRVAAMLCAAGMSVVGEAKTPQSAVEGILGCQPDVVVLDVHLTGGNGLQVLRTVRQVVPGIGFVVFSNDAFGNALRHSVASRSSRSRDSSAAFIDSRMN